MDYAGVARSLYRLESLSGYYWSVNFKLSVSESEGFFQNTATFRGGSHPSENPHPVVAQIACQHVRK